jgi:DNA adenine methylase
MDPIRSPFFYVGDKFKIIREIKQYFPKKIDRFIEPFTGGGTVFLNIEAKQYLLNDIDSNVYALQKYLLQRAYDAKRFFDDAQKIIKEYALSRSFREDIVPDNLKERWRKTYYARFNKSGYDRLKLNYNQSDEKDLLKLYLLIIYGFNRMLRFNSKGQFNLPVGNVDFNRNVYSALNDYFKYVTTKHIKWHNLDFSNFLNSIKYKESDFIYLDPPYLITFSEYNKLWNPQEEIALINLLDGLNKKDIKWAISNVVTYKDRQNTIFNRWVKKYNTYTIKSNYISYHNNSRKLIKEVLVTNYENEKP